MTDLERIKSLQKQYPEAFKRFLDQHFYAHKNAKNSIIMRLVSRK